MRYVMGSQERARTPDKEVQAFIRFIEREYEFVKLSLNYHRALFAGILASLSTISWALLGHLPSSIPPWNSVVRTMIDAGSVVVIVALFYAVIVCIIAFYDWEYRPKQAKEQEGPQRRPPPEKVIGGAVFILGLIGSFFSVLDTQTSTWQRVFIFLSDIAVFSFFVVISFADGYATKIAKSLAARLKKSQAEDQSMSASEKRGKATNWFTLFPLLGVTGLTAWALLNIWLSYGQRGIDRDLFQLTVLTVSLIPFTGAALRILRGVRRDVSLIEWLNENECQVSAELIKGTTLSRENLLERLRSYSKLLGEDKFGLKAGASNQNNDPHPLKNEQ